MRKRLFSSAGLLALVTACPGTVRAQAEEAPPSAVDRAPVLAPAPSQATTVPSTPPRPAAAPSPQTTPSVTVDHDHGWVLIPYFGLNLPVADTANSYSAGFRLGGLAGWYATPRISINGEFTLDLMDGNLDASMLKPHEHYFDFVLSPLLHLRSSQIVVGPKLGWFTNNRSYSASDAKPLQEWLATKDSLSGYTGPILEGHSGQGLLFGINAGGFVSLGSMTVGLLASAGFRHFTTVECGPYRCAGDYRLVTVTNVSLAAMF